MLDWTQDWLAKCGYGLVLIIPVKVKQLSDQQRLFKGLVDTVQSGCLVTMPSQRKMPSQWLKTGSEPEESPGEGGSEPLDWPGYIEKVLEEKFACTP